MSAVAIIFLLWIIVWAVAAALVWENAKDKDVDPAFWAVIVFVTGIFGVVAYAIVVGGSNSSDKRVCPNCNLANNPNSNYCSDCGEDTKILRRENTPQQKTGG